jgi:hypothetical protein
MRAEDGAVRKWASDISAGGFVLWLLFFGTLGLLLLMVVAYATLLQHLALSIVGQLLLAAPIILLTAWAGVAFNTFLRQMRTPAPSSALNVTRA